MSRTSRQRSPERWLPFAPVALGALPAGLAINLSVAEYVIARSRNNRPRSTAMQEA